MIRSLYFYLTARRHLGEAVAFDADGAEMRGMLERVGLLGCSFRQASGTLVHLPYGELTAIATGERVAANFAKDAEQSTERAHSPMPAIFGDELRRMLEEEPA
jgi:hypothetical protein